MNQSILDKRIRGLAAIATAAVLFAACSGSGAGTNASPAGSTATGSGGAIGVTLITKTSTNPFFVAMAKGAKESADKLGITLTTAAGKEDGDTASQIQAIENAISKATRAS